MMGVFAGIGVLMIMQNTIQEPVLIVELDHSLKNGRNFCNKVRKGYGFKPISIRKKRHLKVMGAVGGGFCDYWVSTLALAKSLTSYNLI